MCGGVCGGVCRGVAHVMRMWLAILLILASIQYTACQCVDVHCGVCVVVCVMVLHTLQTDGPRIRAPARIRAVLCLCLARRLVWCLCDGVTQRTSVCLVILIILAPAWGRLVFWRGGHISLCHTLCTNCELTRIYTISILRS